MKISFRFRHARPNDNRLPMPRAGKRLAINEHTNGPGELENCKNYRENMCWVLWLVSVKQTVDVSSI